MARPNGGGQTTGPRHSRAGRGGDDHRREQDRDRRQSVSIRIAPRPTTWRSSGTSREESLLSLALFYKDIDSFVQIIRTTDNFSQQHARPAGQRRAAACGAAIPDRRRAWPAGSSACRPTPTAAT